MRITRRTSGGRGEYEISEDSPEGITPWDLMDKEIILELSDDWRIETGIFLSSQGGKRRLRRTERNPSFIQIQRQIAAALMLPAPVRSNSGIGVEFGGNYAIDHIIIEKAEIKGDKAILRAKNIILKDINSSPEISVIERVAQINEIWSKSGALPENLGDLILEHQKMVKSGNSIQKSAEDVLEKLLTQISEYDPESSIIYGNNSDRLPVVQSVIGTQLTEPLTSIDDLSGANIELKRRTVKEWRRWVNARGAKAKYFRESVRKAYKSTCLICGKSFPPTKISVSGVDSAHILPWNQYELDEVYNGICLCKLHHWAFDESLLRILRNNDDFFVEVPEEAQEAIRESTLKFNVDELLKYEGRLPNDRLPDDRLEWPREQLLQQLNSAQFG
jgi:putative restriction endonuclease